MWTPKYSRTFSRKNEKRNDRVSMGPRAGVFISRVNLYYGCPGYERSYAVSKDSDC